MKIITGILFLSLVGFAGASWAAQELSDTELDRVTAGTTVTSEVLDGALHFQFQKDNGRGLSIDGDGMIALQESPLPGTVGSLILTDNAQSNLQAFLNVNAVNSLLQVLINLNINIESTVGEVRQINLTRDF
jgi:hypothetical protein